MTLSKKEKNSVKKTKNLPTIIGWQEVITLNNFDNHKIKAKIDTGAKNSVLHADNIKNYQIENENWVEFAICQLSKEKTSRKLWQAKLIEYRYITDSGGKKEKRPIVLTEIEIANRKIVTEISLTNRKHMSFEMLIGRGSLKKAKLIVDSRKKYLFGKI